MRMRTCGLVLATLFFATSAHADRRSAKDNTLTADDRAQFRAMGLASPDAAGGAKRPPPSEATGVPERSEGNPGS